MTLGPCEVLDCETVAMIGVVGGTRWICFRHFTEYGLDPDAVIRELRSIGRGRHDDREVNPLAFTITRRNA